MEEGGGFKKGEGWKKGMGWLEGMEEGGDGGRRRDGGGIGVWRKGGV